MSIEVAPDKFPCYGPLKLATLLGPLPFCEFGGFGISRAKLIRPALFAGGDCLGQSIVLDKVK